MAVDLATLLRDKVGYRLVTRPEATGWLYKELLMELDAQDKDTDNANGVQEPRKEKLRGLKDKLYRAIRKEAQEKRVSHFGDTGFDIVPREGDPGYREDQ